MMANSERKKQFDDLMKGAAEVHHKMTSFLKECDQSFEESLLEVLKQEIKKNTQMSSNVKKGLAYIANASVEMGTRAAIHGLLALCSLGTTSVLSVAAEGLLITGLDKVKQSVLPEEARNFLAGKETLTKENKEALGKLALYAKKALKCNRVL